MNVVSALDAGRWSWDGEQREDEHLGRACVALSGDGVAAVIGAELEDGVVEADLALTGGRGFHGLVWRLRGVDYESFYVRPHQNGNPDAIQYTPVFNDVAAWQLHHGEGFWNEVRFPAEGWLTIRVAFAGEAAAVALDGREVLHTRLRHPPRAGGLGLLVAGEVRVSGLRWEAGASVAPVPAMPVDPHAVLVWDVSPPFAEDDVPDVLATGGLTWTRLEAEPSGLANLARLSGIEGGANTVYARTTIHADRPRRQPLDLGFSDRAIVFLNGERIYRGDDSYRSRDYRFLGSIGWWDTLYLPLAAGDNELVVAVSEDFGGWGIQARLPT